MHSSQPNRKKTAPSPLRKTAFFLSLLSVLLCLTPAALAKTYVITDGDRTITYTTFATDPTEILTEAGMALEENDTYTTQDGSSITIRRAMEVCLIYRGEPIRVTSTGETVMELLDRLGLEIGRQDTLSPSPDTLISDGMTIRVDTSLTRQETYTATIPHETLFCADASLPEGTQEVLVEGRDGELLCTAEVSYLNSQEVERKILSENQTIAPITEVIAQGTAVPSEPEGSDMPIIHDGYILMPSGEVLTYYKTDNVTATGYTHTDAGCDMITSTGTTVRYGTAAVDPRFIPYGTRMLIVSHDGQRYYGIATAEDCGGAIKRDRMDLYFPTYEECIEFGRRRCTIYFLG